MRAIFNLGVTFPHFSNIKSLVRKNLEHGSLLLYAFLHIYYIHRICGVKQGYLNSVYAGATKRRDQA